MSRWSFLFLLACGSPEAAAPDSDSDGSGRIDSDNPREEDGDLVQALIRGEADLAEVLRAVAWSGGWPVRVDDGFFFVAEGDAPTSVAGDFTGWEAVPMAPGDGFWWVKLDVPQPPGARYKLVSGGEHRADPWARSYQYDNFGEISFVLPPLDAARIDRWPELRHPGLSSRTVRVYVPEGTGPWPAVYAQDGQNLFDPSASWGGWRLGAAVDQVGPMLVIGIDNTSDRLAEYGHTDDIISGTRISSKAQAYVELVDGVLRSHIEERYPTSGRDGLLGSSMGGLAALHIAVARPGRWDVALSLSGTLGWGHFGGNGPSMMSLYQDQLPSDLVVYVDSGGGPGANGCQDPDGDGLFEDDPDGSDNYCTNRQFADSLAASGFVWGQNLHHWHEPGATHDEAAWAARVSRPLALMR